ncbi:RNA-directed DNA polymerase, eukaryota, reverse transcriptase zinc-binding domain protein, partial [Tanacetum coccineum]
MMNKGKTNNRSNKRNVHLPIRYNDHVCEGDDNGVSGEFENEKLGEANVDYEKNCECLDNSEKKDIEELESNRVNDHRVETNSIDLSKSLEKTYASAIKSTSYFETNKLLFVPTELNEIGEEVVVFDEDLVELGSKKWELTLCGHFIGHTWFKFSNEQGMLDVANQSPWMVNSKPLMGYKWNPNVGMKKIEPKKVPVWIKPFEVPMEAWTTKGISAISSKVDADKGFKETIELQYRDKQHKVEGTKTINVVYDWKPSICSHCVVFGHDHKSCKVRIRTKEEITKDKADANLNINKENGFVQSKSRNLPLPLNSYLNRPRNKVNIFYENFPVLNTKKSQEIHNNKKGKPVGDNNSFTILRDLKDDNIKRINMMKDKMIVDKREENDSLDDMEEMVEDVLEDESEAAKNLEADE